MENLQIFKNPKFGSIQVHFIKENPWFVGSEIAKILGYTNPQKAIRDHVEFEDELTEQIVRAGQTRRVHIINESGLYSLILSSKLPTAKEFKHWVTSDVLPSIRRHGAYMTEQVLEKTLADPDYLIGLLTKMKEEKAKRIAAEKQIELDRPKVVFADAVNVSKDGMLIGMLAKLLHQNGVQTGQKRLFQWMRDNGFLMKNGTDRNMPTQRARDMGLFKVKERAIDNPDGSIRLTRTTLVTGKGQQYFVAKFLKAQGDMMAHPF